MGLVAQGYSSGYYGESQHHQQYAMQQQQQYNYEEYAHYPHPEEYMNERNRAYFHHNGEQYAMPTKQQQRHPLDSDCKFIFKLYFYMVRLFIHTYPCTFVFAFSPYSIISLFSFYSSLFRLSRLMQTPSPLKKLFL
jgi:tRNA isopentenyl-2-thiomethyl-A-37 hydroxylase MiaE